NELTDRIGVSASVPVAKAFESTQSPRVRVQALWVLQRLGALSETQLASAARDPSRDVRVHAQKVLADTTKWSDSDRKLALAGLDDSDAFVQRAAADAMGLHPQVDQIAPLLALLSHVPEADNHLRQVIRISIRDQLLDPAVFESVRKQPVDEADARALAEIANAIQTQAAGAYLIDHVQKFTEPRPELVKYLQHAARLAPETSIASLARFVQEKFADDADLQMELLQSIITGLDQRGSAPGDALRSWGTVLVSRVLDDNRTDALGWTNIPMAGKPRQEDPWVIQQRVSADGDKNSLFYGSLPRGEQLTGTYRSDSFELPAKLSFWCAGHIGFPNKPVVDKNYIRLRDATTSELLAESRPPRNDTAQKFEWDLSKHAGKRGYVELVDGDEGTAYAWLAVGRFSVPGLNPSRTGERRQTAADLAARLQLQDLKPKLTALLASESTDASTRSAAARALVALNPDTRRAALVPLLSDPSLPANVRTQIAKSLIAAQPEQTEKTLAEAMKAVPQRLQLQAAEALAGDNPGTETLFRLIAAGQASPRLLQRPSVRQKLDALKLPGLPERIGELTARLPSENEQVQKLLTERRDAYQKTAGDAEKGAAHFAKHCAVCHQIGGKGAVVGPQLDGIGLRGLERLLEDVLDPNRNVDVAFRTTTLVLDDGKATSGLFRREEGASLVLVDNQGKEFTVPTARVEERVKSELSLMPANVSELLTEPEFRDLIAYLLSQRTQPAPKE
ncbi:MAG TPA: c-type cytochrome, partial [Planctomycetaceae bacterium]|nr:c-type cytochrome [Planctomycetaceae bacterium]